MDGETKWLEFSILTRRLTSLRMRSAGAAHTLARMSRCLITRTCAVEARGGPASGSGRRAPSLCSRHHHPALPPARPPARALHLLTARSYKESRATVDPMKEIVADPGVWAGSLVAHGSGGSAGGGPAWPRALKGSLTAVPTLAFHRAPPAEVAARPSRFPFSGSFSLTRRAGKAREGGDGPPPSQPPTTTTTTPEGAVVLGAAAVHALLATGGLVDPARTARIAAIAAARTFAVLPVIADSFDRGNLGACCRSAEAFGLGGVWVAAPAQERYRPTRGRCSSGAEKWLDVRVFDCRAACIAALRAHGYRIAVAVGPGAPGVVSVEAFDWAAAPTAIVLGNEGDGVSDEFLAAADARVTIPMAGFVESFNVSVAAALILATARRRLDGAAAGGAAAPSLSPAEAEVLSAAMLLRHKGKEWQAPVLEELLGRAEREGARVV
jgi:tRNA (guanosine-2'-O-)-methyltransferase